MVLRTTEYRLQFNAVTNELRKQIWVENYTARGLLRSTNQADHYWAHQLNADELEEDAALETYGGPPPNRFNQTEKTITEHGQRKEKDLLDCAARYPLPHQYDLQSMIGREVAAQTPNWEEEFPQQQYDSSQELQHLANNLSLTSLQDDDQLEKCTEPNVRPLTPIPPHSPIAPLTVADLIHDKQPTSHFPTNSGHYSDGSKSSSHILTRTSRKNYFENKPSPFESFGWNDLKKDVGKKKTYNVHAPKNEVNPHALETWSRRRRDIERYLAEENEKKLKALKGSSMNLSNHSSIWMTEYADNFSTKRKNKVFFNEKLVRPRTAPSVHRPLWWRGAAV